MTSCWIPAIGRGGHREATLRHCGFHFLTVPKGLFHKERRARRSDGSAHDVISPGVIQSRCSEGESVCESYPELITRFLNIRNTITYHWPTVLLLVAAGPARVCDVRGIYIIQARRWSRLQDRKAARA